MERVTWSEVQEFLSEVSRQSPGVELRLPTSAEWERAARSDTTTAYSFGNDSVVDPVGPGSSSRMRRGGSFLAEARYCRSAYRSYVYRRNKYPFLGLRLALVPIRDESLPNGPDEAAEDPASP